MILVGVSCEVTAVFTFVLSVCPIVMPETYAYPTTRYVLSDDVCGGKVVYSKDVGHDCLKWWFVSRPITFVIAS